MSTSNSQILHEPDDCAISIALGADGSDYIEGAPARRILWSNQRNIVRRIANHLARRARVSMGLGPSMPRNHSADYYEEVFSHEDADSAARDYLDGYLDGIRQQYYRVDPNRFVRTDSRHAHILVDGLRHHAIANIAPHSLCEVGSGNGRNLITIASQFPDTALTGYEVTRNGALLAQAIQRQPVHETTFGKTYGVTADCCDAIAAIRFKTASAFELPCDDNTHDVTITSAALSCMTDRVGEALDEIRRVTRDYVILYEPFSDVNRPLNRVFLRTNKRFALSVAEVEKHGFETVALIGNLPAMPAHAYGLLVARVV
jgi:hypothetical protein